uniref:peptidylprolyl isomerase n=1 Tax=Hirondellea gigas TaxID=1518452 RepID=A0A2P2HX48_9CRUS
MSISEVVAEQVDITPNKDGGVMKEILKAGSGDDHPETGDKVSVHYVGTLESDGSKFDSSRDRNEFFEFSLGKGEVIKAWDLGVASMKRGELAKLTCRSDYGYGESGSPPKIPGGATLVFEVELYSWEGEDITKEKDKGILKSIATPGEGFGSPNEGAWVKIEVKGTVNGTVFYDKTVELTLGEGMDVDIPEGVETALQTLTKNEVCKLKVVPKYGFGAAGNDNIGVPANADLDYTVKLIDFEKAKELWEMGQEEKIEQAKGCKDKGTKYFKEGKYQLAIKQYSRVTDLVSYDSGLDDDKKGENHALKLAGELNLALVYLKLGEHIDAKHHASKALEKDPDNVKAYFRKAQAHQHLDELEQAMSDYKKVLSLDASNITAKKELNVCLLKMKEYRQREKVVYSGMFDRFARSDASKAAAAHKNGVLRDGVGEWSNDKKEKEEKEGDLSEVELLSSGEDIKADEFMATS